MPQLKQRFQRFEDYLSFDDGTDKLYELFNGELIEVPPESGLNVEIANFLFATLLPIVGYRRLRGHGLELEVRGEPRNRYPDLTIIQAEHIEQLKQRNTIRLSMAPPLIVMEIVSPGEVQRHRDYIAKRSQYQDLGVPEYWIIDPQQRAILVLELVAGVYTEGSPFSEQNAIRSPQLGLLNLTVAEVFAVAQAGN